MEIQRYRPVKDPEPEALPNLRHAWHSRPGDAAPQNVAGQRR